MRWTIKSCRAATAHKIDAPVAAPAAFLMWPVRMLMWGQEMVLCDQDIYGDCVSTEEAMAKALTASQTFLMWPIKRAMWGYDDFFAFAKAITASRQTQEFPEGAARADDGPHLSVDWTDSAMMASTIYSHGPVMVGVAADQFENMGVTPGQSGWCLHGYPAGLQADHCTSICGYGQLAELVLLFEQNDVAVTVPPPCRPASPTRCSPGTRSASSMSSRSST